MKLEVGMYVRTKWGIAKVLDINEENIYVDRCFQPIDETKCHKKDIIGEPSFNIIDLVEIGDYVNGYKVSSIYNPTGEEIIQFTLITEKGYKIINPYVKFFEIKSVVTKEQFEQMSYKVGE